MEEKGVTKVGNNTPGGKGGVWGSVSLRHPRSQKPSRKMEGNKKTAKDSKFDEQPALKQKWGKGEGDSKTVRVKKGKSNPQHMKSK